jgi:PAS domain S-box-containing protein
MPLGTRGGQWKGLPEEVLRALVDTAPDGIFISTREGRYVEVNQSGHRMLGYEPGELTGRAITDLLGPGQEPRLAADLADMAGGRVLSGAWTMRRKDGASLEVEVTAQHLGSGLVMAIVRDIGPRLRFEREIRASEDRLRSILETAPDIVMTVDRAGTILFINRTEPPLRPEQVIGTCCYDYVLPEARARVEAALDKVFLRAELDEYELSGPPGVTGQRSWMAVRAGPLLEGTQVVAATLCATNISRRKESEALEARLQEQLRESQKLESVGRLAGGIAHDFNNLLTSILGFVELARETLPPQAPAGELLEGALASAKRAATLTQQLLAFARKKVVHPEVVVMNEVVDGLVPMIRRLVGENLDVRVALAPDLASVKVDVGSLEQVVMNLVVNARDAITGAGRITLETANATLDEEYCRRHSGVEPGDYVMLAVRDTGSGMSPDVAALAFEPFFTTKPVGAGTGLGLSMCDGIVRQAGGAIVLDTERGVGSTFRVYLPRVDAVSASPRQTTAGTTLRGGDETILVVEDEPLILQVAERVLTGLGYDVLTARDGVEALVLATGAPGPIELLLTDVIMPKMGGRELAARLTAERPGLRVLYSSGYPSDAVGEDGILAEGIDFLQKPYEPAALAERVREILDRLEDRPSGGDGYQRASTSTSVATKNTTDT